MDVGGRIREARKKKGITLEELAKLVDTTKSTISKYELGRRQPRYEQLEAIAAALDVSPGYLMGEIKTLHIPMPEYPLHMPSQEQIDQMTPTEREYYLLRLLADTAPEDLKQRYIDNYDGLNKLGKVEAVIRTTELTRLHEYTDHEPKSSPEDK